MRAQWLSHHTKRLYNNLSEEERKEFFRLVVPTKDAPMVAREDRGRVQELVTKAFTGPPKDLRAPAYPGAYSTELSAPGQAPV